MKCPRCQNVDLVMSERAGVEIDYCPSCRGVWLDRGELDKIIDRSYSQVSQAPQDRSSERDYKQERYRDHERHERHDDDDHHDHRYRRRSWLSEIFD